MPECSDSINNDGDTGTDFGDRTPNGDPDCDSPVDPTEGGPGGRTECNDGRNNDSGDTGNDSHELIDFPWDPDCDSPADNSENGPNGPDVADQDGFLTGGGGFDEADGEDSISPSGSGTDRVRFGDPLPCDVGGKPGPNQVVQFKSGEDDGDRIRWKLETLEYARCVQFGRGPGRPGASFNHWAGWGTGDMTVGGVTQENVQAHFFYRDSGEPGTQRAGGVDYFAFRVPVPQLPPGGSNQLLMAFPYAFGTLDHGNVQAHGNTPTTTTSPTQGGKKKS